MLCANISGDKGNIKLKAFVVSLVAVAAISIVAAWIFAGIDIGSADVFQLKGSVRL